MTARIFLPRRNFSEGGCSMKITEDVRRYAQEEGISEDEALQAGIEQKARDFADSGAEIYSNT